MIIIEGKFHTTIIHITLYHVFIYSVTVHMWYILGMQDDAILPLVMFHKMYDHQNYHLYGTSKCIDSVYDN